MQDYRTGTFSPTPQSPRRREGLKVKLIANGQQFSRSCLHNEASVKTQKNRFRELLDSWTRRFLEDGSPWESPGRAWKLRALSSIPHLMHLFISILCNICCNKLVNLSISLNSLSCSSKLTELKEGTMGSLIYSQSVGSSRGPDFQLVSESQGPVSRHWALNLWNLRLSPGT